MNNGTTPFYIACQHGHLDVVNRLIEVAGENKAQFFQPMNNGATPFFIACNNGHLDLVDRLIKVAGENKALLFQPMNNGATPFFIACNNGHLDLVDRLIKVAGENKALLFQLLNNGATPFYIACQQGHLSVVNRLLKVAGEDVKWLFKAMPNGSTPLHVAFTQGHIDIVKNIVTLLIEKNREWFLRTNAAGECLWDLMSIHHILPGNCVVEEYIQNMLDNITRGTTQTPYIVIDLCHFLFSHSSRLQNSPALGEWKECAIQQLKIALNEVVNKQEKDLSVMAIFAFIFFIILIQNY